MPSLNFQAQFADAVESGEKRQTIRAYRKDKRDPKPGDTLYLFTGMRTKACRRLGEVECLSAEPFELTTRSMTGNVNMTCGNPSLRLGPDRFRVGSLQGSYRRHLRAIAKADGFDSPDAMVDWFEKTHGLPFKGLLIRWDRARGEQG